MIAKRKAINFLSVPAGALIYWILLHLFSGQGSLVFLGVFTGAIAALIKILSSRQSVQPAELPEYQQDFRDWLWRTLGLSIGAGFWEAIFYTSAKDGAESSLLILVLSLITFIVITILTAIWRHTNKMQKQYLAVGISAGLILIGFAEIQKWLSDIPNPEAISVVALAAMLFGLDASMKDPKELSAYRRFFVLPCFIIFGIYLKPKSGIGMTFIFELATLILSAIAGSALRAAFGKNF